MSTPTIKRFASPYEDPAPAGAEGWEELYPYYLHFREDRREGEEARFWFADTQHWPARRSSPSTRSRSSSRAAASASTTPATTSSRRPTASTTASTTATST